MHLLAYINGTAAQGACRKAPVRVHDGSLPLQTGVCMTAVSARTVDLSHLPASKTTAAVIAKDLAHFQAVTDAIAARREWLRTRLAETRLRGGRAGQEALDRDLEAKRLGRELAQLDRYGVDLCLGRVVPSGGGDPIYIGRMGLASAAGTRLLVDWRAPAAAPFFAATVAEPQGMASRRRYRWFGARLMDFWDELLTESAPSAELVLDEQSAFLRLLSANRSPRMRDVLATMQADQDAIVRAPATDALIVDGGPGTGKTVVALHRAAYLLYADERISHGGGVLFIGPTRAYLDYVDDVLPGLGEQSVHLATLHDLVPEAATAIPESDPAIAACKADLIMEDIVERAVRLAEVPPERALVVPTPWADLAIAPNDWADAFESVETGTDHNDAQAQVHETLVELLVQRLSIELDGELPATVARRYLQREETLATAVSRAWPLLDAAALVAQLWASPGLLARCAQALSESQRDLLHRDVSAPWTFADLPIIDAARSRTGDLGVLRRRRERSAALAAERAAMDDVIDDLLASDDDGEGLVTMLRGADVTESLRNASGLAQVRDHELDGPFGHILVDEAQELTDMQWRMLVRRCPARTLTVVGDRAQARVRFAETWQQRLSRIGVRRSRVAPLTVNYRTPEEIMTEAAAVIRTVLPEANVPTSIRRSGTPVLRATPDERDVLIEQWLAANPDGTGVVIGDASFAELPRVRSLTPAESKGLEFDLVVLVQPERFGGESADAYVAAVDRYVSMTRATGTLILLSNAGLRV